MNSCILRRNVGVSAIASIIALWTGSLYLFIITFIVKLCLPRSLSNDEVNAIQANVNAALVERFNVELR